MPKRMRIFLATIAVLLVGGAGAAVAITTSGDGVLSVCATAPGTTVAGHTVAVDGSPVATTPGVTVPSSVACVTSTFVAPTTTTVPPPPPPSLAQFGLSIPGQTLTGMADANRLALLSDLVAVGAKWLRFDLNWRTVEYTKGVYNWGAFDTVAQEARSKGISVELIVDTTPPWACRAGWTAACNWDSPPDPTAWAHFMGIAAGHYAPMGINNLEVWNEPNLTNSWKGTRDDYIAIVKSGYAPAHQANVNAQVMVGGFGYGSSFDNGTPAQWLTSLYQAGAGADFDIVSTHPYPGGSDSNGTGATGNGWYQMKLMQSVMVQYGDASKKVWGDEYGYTTNGGYLTEAQVQARIVTDTANWKSYPWSGVLMWYTDNDDSGGYGLSNGGFPIVHKPRWGTWQTNAR